MKMTACLKCFTHEALKKEPLPALHFGDSGYDR